MALSIGIVGLPNAGKSTLFNALTRNSVLAANYPFATIEPNLGVVGVPDPRLAILADISPPGIRDAAFSTYFTLAFGIGSLWTAVFGVILGAAGDTAGLPIVFWIMAATFLAGGIAVLPIRTTARDEHTPLELPDPLV